MRFSDYSDQLKPYFKIFEHLNTQDFFLAVKKMFFDYLHNLRAIDLYMYDEKSGTLNLCAQHGLSADYVQSGIIHCNDALVGQVAKNHSILNVPDLHAFSSIPDSLFKNNDFKSFLGLPLHNNQKLTGVLGLYSDKPNAFCENEIKNIDSISQFISIAFRNVLEFESASKRSRRFMAISRAIAVTRQLGTLKDVLDDISKVLVQFLGFDMSWIGLIDPSENQIIGHTGFGPGLKQKLINISFSLDDSEDKNSFYEIINKKQHIICHFIEELPESNVILWLKSISAKSFAFLPIISAEKILGIIGAFYTADQTFQEEDIKGGIG